MCEVGGISEFLFLHSTISVRTIRVYGFKAVASATTRMRFQMAASFARRHLLSDGRGDAGRTQRIQESWNIVVKNRGKKSYVFP